MEVTADVVLTAFRKIWLWDATMERSGTVADYQALFPGFEEAVAAEYRRLSSEHPVSEDARDVARPKVGPYRLERLLGRGGQAAVYAATDERDGRTVALKVLAADAGMSARRLERLRREAAAVGRLDHPAICGIHEAGLDGDVPYLALHHVEGRTLAQAIAVARRENSAALGTIDAAARLSLPPDDAPSPPEAVLRVARFFEEAARAVHAAHEAGLVHRDVKPGNLMVTPAGGPVVLDFGLARDEEEGGTITLAGALLGTPAYMAPEQIEGGGTRIDRRVDVYALGASLYEALTLLHPFETPTQDAEALGRRAGEAKSLRALDPRFPADLDLVVATALRRDRGRRYRTALALAEDLRAFRTGRPIRARPPSAAQRFADWTKRRPALAASAAVALVALAAGLGVSLSLLGDTREAQRGRTQARAAVTKSRESGHARIKFMLGRLQSQLQTVGRLDLVEAIASEATTYFESFSIDELSDDERLTLAEGWASLARAHEMQAHRAEQMRCWDKAAAIREELHSRRPDEPAHARALADSIWARARREQQTGMLDAAIASLVRADELMSGLPPSFSRDFGLRIDHQAVVRSIGTLHRRFGRMDEALAALRRAAAAAEETLRDHPAEVDATLQATQTVLELVLALESVGEPTAAQALLDGAERRARTFLAERPDEPFAQAALADVVTRVSDFAYDRGDFDGAEAAAAEVRDTYARLRERDPRNARWSNQFVTANQRLCRALTGGGKIAQAVDAGREAKKLSDVARRQPAVAVNPQLKSEVAQVVRTYGAALWRSGATDEALEQLGDCAKLLEDAVALAPSDVNILFGVVASRHETGAALGDAAARDAAAADPAGRAAAQDFAARSLAALDDADALARRVLAEHPDAAKFTRERAFILRDAANVRRTAGDVEGAAAALEEAVRVRDGLAAKDALLGDRLGDLDGLLADVRRGAGERVSTK